MNRVPSNTRAFTLTEIMVVITIVVVLTAIALPSYKAYYASSKTREIISLADQMKAAWQTNYETGSGFPPNSGPIGKYINNAVVNSSGITITLNNPSNIIPGLDGAVVTYTPALIDRNSAVSWTCSAVVPGANVGTKTTTTYTTHPTTTTTKTTTFTYTGTHKTGYPKVYYTTVFVPETTTVGGKRNGGLLVTPHQIPSSQWAHVSTVRNTHPHFHSHQNVHSNRQAHVHSPNASADPTAQTYLCK